MMIRKGSALLLLGTGIVMGCASEAEQSAQEPAIPVPASGAAKIAPIEGVAKLTEADLPAFEEKYECKLPDEYRRFLLQNNGGFPSPDCVIFEEAGRRTASDVACFHALGDQRPWASLDWHQETFSGRLPKNTLPIAHDSCGNLWLLNIGPDDAGAVVFWDHGSFDTFDETDWDVWPRVAKSFQEFLDSLREYQPLPEGEVPLSRYALVQKAVQGVADFDKRSMPDGAWHCHYEGDKVSMQFVDYATHAATTHTDGYSDLRAATGLIEPGPTRLPE